MSPPPGGIPNAVALIPARSGSLRVPDKNVRELAGHPLIAYTIAAALESGCFTAVICSTDSDEYAATARRYGAEVPFLRPRVFAGEKSPDIEWVLFTLETLKARGKTFDLFSILRPTSPFRTHQTIRRAFVEFLAAKDIDSLRAVEKCRQHPGKMWVSEGRLIRPLLQGNTGGTPWHSTPYHALPEIYVQNASLEIACTDTVFRTGTISGGRILPFFTVGLEGFDINDEADFDLAEKLAREKTSLPRLRAVRGA